MKKSTLFALAGAAWLFASAASAQPDQPATTTQPTFATPADLPSQPPPPTPPSPSTQTIQSPQVIQSTPTEQPATTPVPAQSVKTPKQVLYGDPCRTELERFCVGSQPQAIRMRCLDSHEAEFSGACQNRRAELRELRASCQTVIEQSCRYVPLFADAILNCLQEHDAELIGPCRSLREKAQKPSHYIAEACQSDVKKFCKDAPLIGFRIAQCLQEHEAELSKPCLAGAPEK